MVEIYIYIYIYIILLLHREQLHVSALDNGHLQVVHESLSKQLYKHIYTVYTGVPGGMCQDFGRVFLLLKYTDITQNTYVQSWTVTEIMAREKCGLIAGPHTVRVSWQSYPFPSLSVVSYDGNSAHASHRTASAMLRHRWAFSCIVLGTLRTTMTWVRVFL